MARPSDYVDPEYDRKLAEYKAMKAKLKSQNQEQPNSGQIRR